MVSISNWRSDLVPGVFCPKIGIVHPRLQSHVVGYKRRAFRSHDCIQLIPKKVPGSHITQLPVGGRAVKCASFVERNFQSSVNDGEDSFFINAMKQTIWFDKYKVKAIRNSKERFPLSRKCTKKLTEDLALDRSMWRTRIKLKTATLALVLVGLFTIALSSVDSALAYMLTLFSWRTA